MRLNASQYNQHWQDKTLNELGDFQRGKSRHRPRNDVALFSGGKHPLIQTGEIKEANLYITAHSAAYNDFGLAQSKLWPKNTLCITIAANIAETALLGYPMCFPDSVVGFNAEPEKSSELFMHYVFTYIRRAIQNSATGSIQDNINIEYLTGLKLKIPVKSYQDKIAAILFALDAKIECNNRINVELEAMVKTLYDYWFVQFDFPDANGKPYKSSGGKMAYNATLKREIPVGWRDGTIGNLISLEYGKGLKAENRTGSGHPVIGSNGVVGYHSEYLVEGPGIVVGRKGTVGAITFIHTDFFPIDTTYYVKPISKIGFLYLKYLLSSLGLEKMNSDSAVPGLNREVALRINTVLPPTTLIQDFERRTAAVFSKLHILVQENQQLAQLRDWLLPLLMNGQVTVAGRRPA